MRAEHTGRGAAAASSTVAALVAAEEVGPGFYCRSPTANVAAAALTTDAVVRTTVYLTDLSDFPRVNQVYAEFFRAPFPARATVQVAGLPRGARVEIDAIAVARE